MTDDEQPGPGATAKVEPGKVHICGEQVTASAGTSMSVKPGTVHVEGLPVRGSVSRQTWRDRQADDSIDPGDFITRDDVLRRLGEKGVAVDFALMTPVG